MFVVGLPEVVVTRNLLESGKCKDCARSAFLIITTKLDLVRTEKERRISPNLIATRSITVDRTIDETQSPGNEVRLCRRAARLVWRSTRACLVFEARLSSGARRDQGIALLVPGGLKREERRGSKQLRHPHAEVRAPDRAARFPCAWVRIRDGPNHEAALPRVCDAGAGARRRIGEDRADQSRRGGEIPGQLSGIKIVRSGKGKRHRARDEQARIVARDARREIDPVVG